MANENMFSDLIPGQTASANMFADLIPKQEPGFLSGISSDWQNRQQQAQDIASQYDADKLNTLGLIGGAGRVGAGIGADIGKEAIKSAWNVLPDAVTQPVIALKDTFMKTPEGVALSLAAPAAQQKATQLAEQYPNAAQWAGFAGNVAQELPMAEGAVNLAKVAPDAAKFAGNAVDDLRNPLLLQKESVIKPSPVMPLTRPAIKKASQNAYQYANDTGGILAPETFTNDIVNTIESAKARLIAGKVLTSEQKALNDSLDEYLPLRDSPLTLSDYENLDKSLGAKESAAMNGFKPTSNSRAIGQVQDAIRERLQALKPQDVIGGKEGFDALSQHAVPLWATQAKMADLEAIINRANMMDNPTTAMRTGFRNLSLNEAKMNSYPPEVQTLIRKAAASGDTSDLLGILGSRLNPIMNTTMAGKATNLITSKIFRNIRNSMQNAQADKIMSALTEPVRDSVERFTPAETSPSSSVPRQLTYQPSVMSVPTEGASGTIPMNPYIRETLGQSPGTTSERFPSASIEKQDVFTPQQAAETMAPKTSPNMYSGITAKIDAMRPEFRAQRLASLNKKAASNAGLTTSEMAEMEALKDKKFSKGGSVRKNLTAEFLATRKRA